MKNIRMMMGAMAALAMAASAAWAQLVPMPLGSDDSGTPYYVSGAWLSGITNDPEAWELFMAIRTNLSILHAEIAGMGISTNSLTNGADLLALDYDGAPVAGIVVDTNTAFLSANGAGVPTGAMAWGGTMYGPGLYSIQPLGDYWQIQFFGTTKYTNATAFGTYSDAGGGPPLPTVTPLVTMTLNADLAGLFSNTIVGPALSSIGAALSWVYVSGGIGGIAYNNSGTGLGINTTNISATLDIRSLDQTSPLLIHMENDSGSDQDSTAFEGVELWDDLGVAGRIVCNNSSKPSHPNAMEITALRGQILINSPLVHEAAVYYTPLASAPTVTGTVIARWWSNSVPAVEYVTSANGTKPTGLTAP